MKRIFTNWNTRKTTLARSIGGIVGGCLIASYCLASDPVNINLADAATIADRLNGIGPVKAQAIVEFREQHGKFKSVEQLQLVSGIGESLYLQVKPYLLIEEAGIKAKSAGNPAVKPADATEETDATSVNLKHRKISSQ